MKIVFINPWSPDEEFVTWTPYYQKTYWRNAYYGLVQLATYIRSKGNEVSIIDLERDLLIEASGYPKLLLQQLKQKITSLQPDIVGITGVSWRYLVIGKIIEAIEPLRKKIGFNIIQGGHHAIATPQSCLEDHKVLDAVFCGYSELGLPQYLSGEPKNKVSGIVFREGHSLSFNENRYIENLDLLPFPDWNLLDAKFYSYPSVWIHRSFTTPMKNLDTITSRGCVYHCRFCTGYSTKPLWHSPEYIIEYIQKLQREFGVNSTIFQDSSLGNNRSLLVSICEGLIDKGINKGLIWTACMRANQVTEEIAKLMYRAGCRMVFIGFETASDRLLEKMNKGITQEDNTKCAEILEKSGLPYWASFIVGYPSETQEELKQTIEFSQKIHPLAGWANQFFPCPGSLVFNDFIREGKLKQPKNVKEWVELSYADRGQRVKRGEWANMPHDVFVKLAKQFQYEMQSITNKGMRRKLEFS